MPAGREDDGSSASPLTLAGKTRLPGLVTDLTFALFAQPVFGSRRILRTDALRRAQGWLSARFEGPLRKPSSSRWFSRDISH
jgi:hypothetical protein